MLTDFMSIDTNGAWHLLYPLFSSMVFVVGALFAKESSVRGANPYTNVVASNLCLAFFWVVFGGTQGCFLPVHEWGPAAAIGATFVIGQVFTYLAFQYGDVSLATPVLGVKIILVAIISSLLAETPVAPRIWGTAVLASLAVGIVQAGGGNSSREKMSSRQAALTVAMALTSALAFSCFDVGLQVYCRRYGMEGFLSTMFVFMGGFSCLLLPWADRPSRLHRMKASGPLVLAAVLMAIQAVSLSYALGRYGDVTRVNIIYALRGLWSVVIAWVLGRMAISPEGWHSNRTMWFRLTGAVLLLICVVVALS